MLAGLSLSVADLVVIAALLVVVGFVIRGMIRRRKAGRSSCGCGCSSCEGCAGCAEKK